MIHHFIPCIVVAIQPYYITLTDGLSEIFVHLSVRLYVRLSSKFHILTTSLDP